MKVTTRLSRRIAAGIGIAGAAVLLPTAALASSAATGASSHPAVAGCTAANTRVWYGAPLDHAAGHTFVELQFSNIGHFTCSFFGYPGVSALDKNGHQAGLPATHSGPRQTVTLAPGTTGHVLLVIRNASLVCAHPLNTATLRVFSPNQFHAKLIPFPSQGCPGKSVMHVDAMHPRAGIPGFSNS